MNGIHHLQTKRGLFTETSTEGQRHEVFNEISGHLVNITFKQTDFGNIMKLHIVDPDKCYIISMFINSRPATAFLMLVPSFNLQHEITLKISRQNGLDYLRAYQFDYPVGWYKRFPGYGDLLPKDSKERIAYLLDYVKAEIVPILAHMVSPYKDHPAFKAHSSPEQSSGGYQSIKGNFPLSLRENRHLAVEREEGSSTH